jgi:3-oxoacyl-[acyl-carrier protein] reductase
MSRVASADQKPKPLEDVSVEDFHQIVDANLTGAFLFAQAVAPGMKRAGKGRIVTISSRAALAPSLTGIQAYASAKHGQLGLVRQLAHELGQFGITVNTVAPGFLRTSPDYEPQWEGWVPRAEAVRGTHRHAPDGTPQDIAHAVCSWLRIMLPGSPADPPVMGSPT